MKPIRKRSSIYQDVDSTFTVMLLGDSCTGKTCLLVRYKDGAFLNNNFISTIGIDYRNKVIELDDKKINLQIWDTAGQERFRSVTASYYRDADALLLVYDIANRTSFENIRSWLAQIKEYGKDAVEVSLVANKCDLGSARKVKSEEGRHLAQAYGIPYIETSAKTGHNVSQAFTDIARRVMAHKLGEPYTGSAVVDLATSEPQWKCCSYY
ncbi:unnamed protein product [Caenorhabditis auriculariae]|uniref:Uncharacterized protein n=1 Tax=Caenorhabditis auriculariae TaxID=2777116 RepID=A0A8S1GPV1_9PELO|nr:unnamed protein product [Caenorhabditis auriculariae]